MKYALGFLAYQIVIHWPGPAPLWLLPWAGYYAYFPEEKKP